MTAWQIVWLVGGLLIIGAVLAVLFDLYQYKRGRGHYRRPR